MTCSLLDIICHAQNGLWSLWDGLPWHIQALYVLGVLAIIGGVLWSLTGLIRAIGGWPAVAGVGAVILATVLMLIPRRPTPRHPEPHENVEDEEPVVRRKPSTQKKPRTRTIFDQLGKKP